VTYGAWGSTGGAWVGSRDLGQAWVGSRVLGQGQAVGSSPDLGKAVGMAADRGQAGAAGGSCSHTEVGTASEAPAVVAAGHRMHPGPVGAAAAVAAAVLRSPGLAGWGTVSYSRGCCRQPLLHSRQFFCHSSSPSDWALQEAAAHSTSNVGQR
jgi:hypothetical protein